MLSRKQLEICLIVEQTADLIGGFCGPALGNLLQNIMCSAALSSGPLAARLTPAGRRI